MAAGSGACVYCFACNTLESVEDDTPSATRTMPTRVVLEVGPDSARMRANGRNDSPYINVSACVSVHVDPMVSSPSPSSPVHVLRRRGTPPTQTSPP